mgnify:CR=1 FL=1
MLNVLGTTRRLCDGLTRREALQVGSLGAWGLTMANAASWASDADSSPLPHFGKAKRCLLVFLFGGVSSHETLDPKPDAPFEIQGELKAIPSSLTGVAVGEGLPKVAEITDRLTVVRSMNHPYPLHGVAYALSGLPVYTTDLEVKPRDPAQWPYFGSIADYLWAQRSTAPKDLLQHVGLPWVFNSQVDDLGLIAGPYASFLGQQYDPLWVKFDGKGTRLAPKCRHEQAKEYLDPYASTPLAGRFDFDGIVRGPQGLPPLRMNSRQSLLDQFDQARRLVDDSSAVRNYSSQEKQALSLLTSTQMQTALDIGREPDQLRDQYGHTVFGQSCLAARRLLEAGSRFVSVFWDAYGTYFSGGWDTHQNHYPRMKEYLLPGFDGAFATLIRDLEQRGLLEDTLVVCTTEHGRTPQIDSKPVGAARHHWSRAYSTALAGGGIAKGRVVGRTDAQGGDVAETPISPKDIQATAFHLLGISPNTLIHDRQNRPYRIAGDGQVRGELLA